MAAPEACINLLPTRAEHTRQLVRVASIMAYGLLGVSAALWIGISSINWQRQDVERRLRDVTARQQQLAPLRILSQAVEAHEMLVREVTAMQAAPVEWLRRLAEGFPEAVRLTSLSDDAAGLVHLTGQAQGRVLGSEQTPEAAVSEFAMWLQQSGLCGDVRLGSSQRSASMTDIVEFEITCHRS